ncbi:hypothetical protein B0H13DRAFT_1043878 [Mycena leptocephala]|nr:hypothetical protein B0H13DRAFT_1043878 [Mycena leptocephala]
MLPPPQSTRPPCRLTSSTLHRDPAWMPARHDSKAAFPNPLVLSFAWKQALIVHWREGVGADVFDSPTRPFRGDAAPLRLHIRAAPCVCGFKFPTRAAIPHCEHRIPSSSLASSRTEYTRAYLPAIHAAFSHRDSSAVYCCHRRRFYRLLARQVRLQHVPLSLPRGRGAH